MELSGFYVSVHSDGEKLKEHSVEVSPDGKKAACWIPSQSGKEFVVKFGDGESSVIKNRGKSVHVYTDGHRMGKRPLLPYETRGKVAGVRISQGTERPFIFADIRTTDGDTIPGDIHVKPEEIGTISVSVFLVENRRHCSPNGSRKYSIQDRPPAVIEERAKKAGEHCVSLGEARQCGASRSCTGNYDPKKPELVFEFRYRSTAMLQALGIIPPPKRETPPIIDLEDEDLPPPKRQKTAHDEGLVQSMQTELERLRRRVGELEGKKAGPSGVKKEAKKHDPADIIDLT